MPGSRVCYEKERKSRHDFKSAASKNIDEHVTQATGTDRRILLEILALSNSTQTTQSNHPPRIALKGGRNREMKQREEEDKQPAKTVARLLAR
jgi:hypothetical protein